MSDIYFHNTLSGKKEKFVPADPDHVSVYVCGPTVYSYVHIGNGRPAVVFDVLVKLLRSQYANVNYVSNITIAGMRGKTNADPSVFVRSISHHLRPNSQYQHP